ncbi:TetR/AcrR family transcriptional regulator [Brevibacillus reuszeri]|uniref:TetR/AcrR family transcriptional regulator n=1 Tax=Brevibacillus reuszeri TaxID=54915 RepID=UPI00289956C1|nr:TetR/AcrR family transcriptional regulator [Brevibacillus reuszeri]
MQHTLAPRSLQSREWIILALIQLMEKKAYSLISITEITRKAGLARQTFYRNYQDKDDVLFEYLCNQYETYWSVSPEQSALGKEMLITLFHMWKEQAPPSLIENIWNGDRKIRQIIFRSVEHYIQKLYQGGSDEEEREEQAGLRYYALRSLASTLHVLLIEWTIRFFQESPEEMGTISYELTSSMREFLRG